MSCTVFYPDDLLVELEGTTQQYVVGYGDNHGNIVIVAYVPRSFLEKDLMESWSPIDGLQLAIVGTFKFARESLLEFTIKDGIPLVSNTADLVSMVIFRAANSVHMEFYSLNSILIRRFSKGHLSSKLATHLIGNSMEVTESEANFDKILFVINSIDYLRYKFLKLDEGKVQTGHISQQMSAIIHSIVQLCHVVGQTVTCIFRHEFALGVSLVKMSTTLHQATTRMELLCNLPLQFRQVKQKTTSLQIKPSLPNYNASLKYIGFYNALYIILVDILLGNIFRGFIEENKYLIVAWFQYLKVDILYVELAKLINKLMDNPGGFKLNAELSNFIGELYLWALRFWYKEVLTSTVSHYAEAAFNIIFQLSRVFGLTMILAICSDLASLAQFHVLCFSVSMARIYNWQLKVLKSLFRLFYGKKYNMLRNRIDSQSYNLDQLLLGIIIFTVLIYLIPTIMAFYISFFLANFTFYCFNMFLQITILFMNHLPVFIILISLKNPKRLSDGLTIELIQANDQQVTLSMRSKSLSLFKLLKYYWQVANLKTQLISPRKVLLAFVSGEMVEPVDFKAIYESFANL